MDDRPLDQTTLSVISLLESRLLRLEHVLCGPTPVPSRAQQDSVAHRMGDLERRFSGLLSHVRVYCDLLKIYTANPDFFHASAPSEPPCQLSNGGVRSIVLASTPAFPAVLSSLTAIKDSPIPDACESAALISETERMKAIRATQLAQAAEMADLRYRSEAVVRSWYEGSFLVGSQFMADVEARIERAERRVRRNERVRREYEEL